MWSGFETGVVNQNAVAAITTEEAHSLWLQLSVQFKFSSIVGFIP